LRSRNERRTDLRAIDLTALRVRDKREGAPSCHGAERRVEFARPLGRNRGALDTLGECPHTAQPLAARTLSPATYGTRVVVVHDHCSLPQHTSGADDLDEALELQASLNKSVAQM